MADPKLKTIAPAGAPRRVLLNSGVVPTRRVTLKGADGRTIGPKSPAAPPAAPTAETPQPAVDEEALLAQQEYERQVEEYNRQMEEYNRQMAEYEAQVEAEKAAAAAEAAAQAAAAEAAAAEAAAQAAAEAENTPEIVTAPAPVAAPQPVAGPRLAVKKPAGAPTAGPKLAIAKPAGAKPAAGPKLATAAPTAKPAAGPKLATAAPAAKPTAGPKLGVAKPAGARPAVGTALPANVPPPPAPVEDGAEEYTEEAPEMTAEQAAYYEKLQAAASKKPFHKRPIFFIACGILLVMAIVGFIMVHSSETKNEELIAKRKAAAAVLNRALEINQKEIFTLEDAKNKGVTIVCSPEDADLLLHIILNHDEKDDNGNLCWGPNTVGTALNGCVLLGIASEQDPAICDKVFNTLTEHATKLHPDLLRELLDRLTKTDIKDLNNKLNAINDKLSPKDNADVLAVIWEFKARLATMDDKDRIMSLIKTKGLNDELVNAVSAYTFELIKSTDNKEKKAALGKLIWETIKNDESSLNKEAYMRMLAYTCQPDALEFYKGKMENKDNWKKYSPFFGAWHGDEIASYLDELRSTCGPDDEKKADIIDNTIMRVLTQDRERSAEDANKLLTMAYDDFFADVSALTDLIDKEDKRTKEENEELDRLKKLVLRQSNVVENLGKYCKEYYDWVDDILNKIDDECDKYNSQDHKKLRKHIKKVRKTIKDAEINKNNKRAKKEKRKKK